MDNNTSTMTPLAFAAIIANAVRMASRHTSTYVYPVQSAVGADGFILSTDTFRHFGVWQGPTYITIALLTEQSLPGTPYFDCPEGNFDVEQLWYEDNLDGSVKLAESIAHIIVRNSGI